jgi:hypothetical protein
MVYARPRIDSIEKARAVKDAAERKAAESIGRLAPHVDRLAHLDGMLGKALDQFTQRLVAARTAVAQDAGITGNITQELAKPEKLFGKVVRAQRGISKSAQVQAVVGEGGLADQFLGRIKEASHDPADVRALAEAMRSRLSRWGARSVNAAEVPALAALDETLDSFVAWAKEYQAETAAIDDDIYGELTAARHYRGETRRQSEVAIKAQKERMRAERENLRTTHQRGMAQAEARFVRRISRLNNTRAIVTQRIVDDAEGRAQFATKAVLDKEIMPKVRGEIAGIDKRTADEIGRAREQFNLEVEARKGRHAAERAKMQMRHEGERAVLAKRLKTLRAAHSALVNDLQDYARDIDGFRQAIADHPATEFRDAQLVLFEKHLMNHEMAAELIAQTERYVRRTAKAEDAERRVAELHSDPTLLANYMAFRFMDIFGDPRLDPELKEAAQRARTEAWESADAELKTMIAQGYRVQYIPASDSTDALLGRDAIKPLVGRKPTVEMASSRAWDYTARTGDAAIGISKAAVEALRRSVTIEFVEEYLRPFAMTRKDVMDFVQRLHGPLVPRAGEIPLRYADTIKDLGMKEVDPETFFGVKLPRLRRDGMFIPTPMYNALRQIMDAKAPIGAKITRLYKYSVLGLSPRYDAHILFGATTMLALRSGPDFFRYLPQAWRMVRDGGVPEEMRHMANTEEGFEGTAFRLWREAAGRKLGAESVAEQLETVQKVPRRVASLAQKLKAMADLNFRFTRYVRDIQMSVAYLDAFTKATKADEKVSVAMADSDRTVSLSARRAMHEAMHHVQRVYGDLTAMSPFERRVAQSIIPFYGWQRHMMGYVLSFPIDHPYRAMILSQAAERAAQDTPAAYPIRTFMFLFTLGSSTNGVDAIDIRTLDPFRTTANYFSLTGWLETINPALLAPVAMVDPSVIYGENALYPSVTYTAFYGHEIAGSQGTALTGLEQMVPQLGAVTSALSSITSVRSLWDTDRTAAVKELLSSLEIPFVTPPVNLKELAARDEGARYEAAKNEATQAFQTGTFKSIAGFRTVPNPLNPDYTITPQALETLYTLARQQYPTLAPIEALTPPPTPYGF